MPKVPICEVDPVHDDQASGTYPSSLTRKELETVVKMERLDLHNNLKPCGAKALRQHLLGLGIINLPAESTIGRILQKHGLIYGADSYHSWD